MTEIEYKSNVAIETRTIVKLYRDAELPRPVEDETRIAKMFANSNLVVSAWQGDELIGIARALTDFSWCCYLADLTVRTDVQRLGVGRELIKKVRETIGKESNLLLLSVPEAMNYYPKIGMQKIENGFILSREI